MARTVTGEGLVKPEDQITEPCYYASKCGPTFACGYNNKLPCAWGAAKVMLALGSLPAGQRTHLVQNAIDVGVAFLLGIDPATARYPSRTTSKPSPNWRKFGFPVFYITDILQVVEALVRLGFGKDPRLANALGLIRSKQDDQGHWSLEYDYSGKNWVDFGQKNQPSKWVTLRALRVLKAG